MIVAKCELNGRIPRVESIVCDLVVVGGGMTGVCAAIAAARHGMSVTLVQDRPVLGGNASSEIRLWVLGATSHMGNNNRWAREGGIIDEILVENLYRNKEGNPVILDALLLDKVYAEKNIRLLLNTVVTEVFKSSERTIESVKAYNPQSDVQYLISAPLFCDSSGDGVVAYQAGAAFRMGAEDSSEFKESFSASEEFGELLGHSMYFYTKTLDKPVKFVAPDFALKDMTIVPKYESIKPDQWGCNYWWFEYGGELDTVHDTEKIKFRLQQVIYGAWDYIKNSGKFPEAENMTLEWVAAIPGKRESRRFEGLYMLNQSDIVEQHHFDDTVAFGGWAIDLHPAKGVFSPLPSCTQYHSKGIYEIPYRCYVCKDIDNLFLSGRNISSSHVAFGSTRVMATSAFGGQAVGVAAALCKMNGCLPASLLEPGAMKQLQQTLNLMGQSIPLRPIDNAGNIASEAAVSVSSTLSLDGMPASGRWMDLQYGVAQMLPLKKGTAYSLSFYTSAAKTSELTVELYASCKPANFTPDLLLESRTIAVSVGENMHTVAFSALVPEDQYCFFIFRPNPEVSLAISDMRCTGVLSLFNKFNLKVNNRGRQMPPEGSGFESFEFWCPDRRPAGHNLAFKIAPAVDDFVADNVMNGFVRPTLGSNAWVASMDDNQPSMKLQWDTARTIKELVLYFDTDYDHAMESVQFGHPEDVIPFCVRSIKVMDASGRQIAFVGENHQTIVPIKLQEECVTDSLIIEMENGQINVPVSLFELYIR